MKFKIGDTLLDNNVFLAPMAGVTDLPFRLLCREQGAGMSVTEMVSAKAILYKNKNTKELLAVDPAEGPVSVQLFGSDPEIIQFKQGDVWVLYAKYQGNGYLKTKTHNFSDSEGIQHSKEHSYWTQKGRLFLYDLLKQHDVLPLMEV